MTAAPTAAPKVSRPLPDAANPPRLRLLRDQVLVLQDERPPQADESESGILLNIVTWDDSRRPNRGTVYLTGSKVQGLRVGERVLFSRYAGAKIDLSTVPRESFPAAGIGFWLIFTEGELFASLDAGADVDTGETLDVGSVLQNLGGDFGSDFDI